jgi:hypothetical protein
MIDSHQGGSGKRVGTCASVRTLDMALPQSNSGPIESPAQWDATPEKLRNPRQAREWRTVAAMVRCYCRGRHGGKSLCPECQGLLEYATIRLERCRFGEEKPTCVKCPVHCYQRDRREQIRVVMRYAGPRMIWQHPILSLRHWWDGRTMA